MRTHTKRSTALSTRLTTGPQWSSPRTWFAYLGVLVMLIPSPVLAATWNAPSGEWDDPLSWDTSLVPTSTDPAIVNNGSTILINNIDADAQRITLGTVNGGSGTIDISNAGTLTTYSNGSNIGQVDAGMGVVNVDGIGSSFNAASNLVVGDGGNGSLNVSNGGLVAVDSALYLGDSATGVANVLVTGDGSQLTTSQFLILGRHGHATVTLSDGGLMDLGTNIILSEQNGTGTLNIGNGGAAGILSATGIDGGTGTATVNFNHTDADYYFTDDGTASGTANTITGSTTVNHLNTGTTTLTGTHNYTGATDVNLGTLRLDNADVTTRRVRLGINTNDDGTFEILDGSTVTSGQDNIGSDYSSIGANADTAGSVLVDGAGSTWTNAADLYVGDSGDGTLTITNGGSVENLYSFVGTSIGSTGNATVDGENSTWTSNESFYIGGYQTDVDGTVTVSDGGTINALNAFIIADAAGSTGTLNIGNGGAAGIINTATIEGGDGDAIINFIHTDEDYYLTTDGTADGDNVLITGSTTVDHNNIGKTTLDGNHTYTGDTNVNAGWLHIPGSIAGHAIVADGARLSGAGTIGGNLANFGQLSPGNSIGTMTINGDYDHLADATLDIEINDGGNTPGVNNDLLDIAGAAELQGGTVNVIAEPGDYTAGVQYTFLDADGGVTGTFTSATHDFANLFTVDLGYTATTAYAEIALIPTDYEGIGTNANERSIGRHLDEAYLDSFAEKADLYNELGGLKFDHHIRDAMQQLSGETIGAGTSTVIQNTHRTQGVLFHRVRPTGEGARSWPTRPLATASNNQTFSLAAADDDELDQMLGEMHTQRLWVPWVQGYGEYGDVDSSAGASGFDYTTGGALFGVDRNVSDNWLVGAFGGYGRSDVDSDFGRQDLDIDHLQLGAHARYERGAWYAIGSIFTGYQRYDSERRVQVGNITEQAEADYNGGQFGTALELGRTYTLDAWTLQPLAGLQYTFLHREGFTESGAPNANLSVGSEDTHSLRSSLGVNVSRLLRDRRESQVLGHLRARWMHEFADDSGSSTAQFAGSNADAFTVDSASLGRDTAMLGAGIDWRMNNTTSLAFNYDAEFNDRFVTHHGSVTLRFVW